MQNIFEVQIGKFNKRRDSLRTQRISIYNTVEHCEPSASALEKNSIEEDNDKA